MITIAFTIDSTIESFGDNERTALLAQFSTELPCAQPTCQLYMTVTPSSLRIEITAIIPNPIDVTEVTAGATRLADLTPAELTTLIDFEVINTMTVTVAQPQVKPAPSLPLAPPVILVEAVNEALTGDSTVSSSAFGVFVGVIAFGVAICVAIGLAWRTISKSTSKDADEGARGSYPAIPHTEDEEAEFTMTPRGPPLSPHGPDEPKPEQQVKIAQPDPESPAMALSLDTSPSLGDASSRSAVTSPDMLDGITLVEGADVESSELARTVEPGALIVAAGAAAALRRQKSRDTRQQRRLTSQRHTVDPLSGVQRSISTHRKAPTRKTEDTLDDVLASENSAYRAPPMRATSETCEQVVGTTVARHRPPPKRCSSSNSSPELADLAMTRKRSVRQYRPAPLRTVVTPGLPPLGAGAVQIPGLAPLPLASGTVQMEPLEPPADEDADLNPDLPATGRSSIHSMESAQGALDAAHVQLAELMAIPSPDVETPDAAEARRRLRETRKDRRADRRASSSTVQQYL